MCIIRDLYEITNLFTFPEFVQMYGNRGLYTQGEEISLISRSQQKSCKVKDFNFWAGFQTKSPDYAY